MSSSSTPLKNHCRLCNAFESFFAAYNVRFAVLVAWHSYPSLQQVIKACSDALRHSPLGYLELNLEEQQQQYGILTSKEEEEEEGEEEETVVFAQRKNEDLMAYTIQWRNEPHQMNDNHENKIVIRSELSTQENVEEEKYAFHQEINSRVIDTFQQQISSNKWLATGPAIEPLFLLLDQNDTEEEEEESSSSSPHCAGVIFNACHALCDGKAMTSFVSLFLQQLNECKSPSRLPSLLSSIPPKFSFLEDWGELIHRHQFLPNWNDEPRFLIPLSTKPVKLLTIQELFECSLSNKNNNKEKGTEMATLRYELNDVTLQRILNGLRQFKQLLSKREEGVGSDESTIKIQAPSMTGLLIVALLRPLAQRYQTLLLEKKAAQSDSGIHKDTIEDDDYDQTYVSASVLVDLRPFLHTENNKNSNNNNNVIINTITQCIGTINVYLSCRALLDCDTSSSSSSSSSLFSLAASTTTQLQERIGRGEAHRCAMSLTSGDFDQSSPGPATLELSNLGLLDCIEVTSNNEEEEEEEEEYDDALPSIHTEQRFDKYDGVSVMTHTEQYQRNKNNKCDDNDDDPIITTTTKTMRFVTSVGIGLDGNGIDSAMKQTLTLLQSL